MYASHRISSVHISRSYGHSFGSNVQCSLYQSKASSYIQQQKKNQLQQIHKSINFLEDILIMTIMNKVKQFFCFQMTPRNSKFNWNLFQNQKQTLKLLAAYETIDTFQAYCILRFLKNKRTSNDSCEQTSNYVNEHAALKSWISNCP